MTPEERTQILRLLDWERQTIAYPGVTRISERGLAKDISEDGESGEIVYSSCSEREVDQIIKQEIQKARSARYELEWKLYEHDQPHCLGERLSAAGFTAGDWEAFMVFRASEEALRHFGDTGGDIRRVTNPEGLADYQRIVEEAQGASSCKQIAQYAFMLENHPSNMSIYVAYVGGEPAACGRIYFHEQSQFAALYGGNTRERFRKRGLFTQVVAARIREALRRGVVNICVDALPTSEPILEKRGFEIVTYTRPYLLPK